MPRLFLYFMSVCILANSMGCKDHPSAPSTSNGQYRIVYNKLLDNFVINIDGTERISLTDGLGPQWSPTDDLIAFYDWYSESSPFGSYLYTIKSDGTNKRPITLAVPEGETLTSSLSWSPNGKQIVFFTTKYHSSGFAVINVDGSNERNLTPEGFWRTVRWSPDGSKIALEGAPAGAPYPSIYIINPNGTGMYNLIDAFAVAALWRPDGNKIAFSVSNLPDTTVRWKRYVANPDGSALQLIDQEGKSLSSWSPEGNKLLYLVEPKKIERRALTSIGVMKADGTDPKILLPADDYHGHLFPTFSPDGEKIAYVRLSYTGTEDFMALWVMNSDATNPQKLDSANYTTPIFYDWSPR